jgi:hypothetical protein
MIQIKQARKGKHRFHARKYAIVQSHTDPNKTYSVGKFRKRGAKHYYYRCTCPDSFFKNKVCKHIKEFIRTEKEMENEKSNRY